MYADTGSGFDDHPGLKGVSWADRYSSGTHDLLASFYAPALRAAATYDRATGYFRSSFLSLTSENVASFALRGGRIRLICSPDLEAADIAAIREGVDAQEASNGALRREIARILAHPHSATGAELLAALYAGGHLEIRLAVPAGRGIFHDKFGIFSDSFGNRVSFAGSINETWQAWHPYGNHESFEAFTSWGAEARRPFAHMESFENLWTDEAAGLSVIRPSQDALQQLAERIDRDPVDVLASAKPSPARGHGKTLMDHQRRALRAWQSAGKRGIFKHATGSGKTVTALEAIRRHLADESVAIVLVPSALLLEQWDAEVRNELGDMDPPVLLAGAGHTDWRGLLRVFTEPAGGARLVISTMATASSSDFLKSVRGGDHLLLVADEVHRLGADKASSVLTIDALFRLGLSATPERSGDPIGTARIFDYFGDVVEPEFTLADAVAAGRLCQYEYHVHPIYLTGEEEEEWEALSLEIKRAVARSGSDVESIAIADAESYLKALLIRRARVAKKASQKLRKAAEILRANYEPGERWLVYCDDITQLEEVRDALDALGLRSMPYFADMEGDHAATLDRFERSGGILVAIKCLDEGVDIPTVSHALIAASSRNPREFIQRRGRVLRVAPGKRRAVIHDLMVDPPSVAEAEAFRPLILGEMARAAEFAQHSTNASAKLAIDELAIKHGINPEELSPGGYEDEEEAGA